MQELNVNPLAQTLLRHIPEPGKITSDIPGVNLFHMSSPSDSRAPIVYRPCLYIVAQGSKSALLGEEQYVYDALNFLVLSVPLPLQCMITQASIDRPYLAICIDIDLDLLHDLIIEMDITANDDAEQGQRGIFVASMKNELLNCMLRMLQSLDNPKDAKVLGPLAIKEALYHVLNSEHGQQLLSFAHRDRHNAQIANVINHIQHHYSGPLEVSELARRANMSVSSFHHYFKTVTNVSPLQYVKTMRLHEARKKMLLDNLAPGNACYEVGYSSPSQFSREYKRLFGNSPSKDIEQAKEAS